MQMIIDEATADAYNRPRLSKHLAVNKYSTSTRHYHKIGMVAKLPRLASPSLPSL